MNHFILYSRSYCHLCDDMLQALRSYGCESAYTIEVIDVDADAALVAQYDELVPVLVGIKVGAQPTQICHYFLDETALKGFLEQ